MKMLGVCALAIAAQCLPAAQAACTVSTTGVIFGAYDVFSTLPTDSAGVISVSCTESLFVTVAIGSSGTSGVFNPRQMRHLGLGDRLSYNLYTDATFTTLWGDGTGGTATQRLRSNKNKPKTVTVYGRVPAAQDVSAGPYSDSLLVTVIF